MTMNAAKPNGTTLVIEMYTVTEVITPEIARWYLQSNKSNRPVSAKAVDRIAWDMRTGKFVLTEQGIAFDKDGNLVDGQHRLHAIIKADMAQTMRVTFNAPGIEVPRDRGQIRAVGDFLLDAAGARVDQPTRVAAICAAVNLLLTRREERPSIDHIRSVLEEHRDGVDWVLEAMPARQPAFIQAALAYAYPCNRAGVSDFAAKYISLADLPKGAPALLLHRSVRELTHYRSTQKVEAMLRTLRCVQLHILNRTVLRITNLEDGFEYFEAILRAVQASRAAS
jgi:hypothetical protein